MVKLIDQKTQNGVKNILYIPKPGTLKLVVPVMTSNKKGVWYQGDNHFRYSCVRASLQERSFIPKSSRKLFKSYPLATDQTLAWTKHHIAIRSFRYFEHTSQFYYEVFSPYPKFSSQQVEIISMFEKFYTFVNYQSLRKATSMSGYYRIRNKNFSST